LGVGQLDDPVETVAGHERIEVDVAELSDPNAIKRGGKPFERYHNSANYSLLGLEKTFYENPSG
jgi:hypothetical protein